MAQGRRRHTRVETAAPRYPRTARVNQILREVVGDELSRLEDVDERFGLLTVTAVQCDADMRHAVVLFSSMSDEEAEALSEVRVRLQTEISRQVKLKWTPLLSFAADPAVAAGQVVEDILRGLPEPGPSDDEEA